jgi:4'-phosphopantetheinyl transferase
MRRQVHVWLARPAAVGRIAGVLSALERAEIERSRTTAARADRSIAWSLLRVLAGAYLDRPAESVRVERSCPVCGGAHGRPRIRTAPADPLEVSLSHAPGLIALAFARAPVGVDVEQIGAAEPTLREIALTPEERARVARGGPAAFAFLWTRREALAKAIGTGWLAAPEVIEQLAAARSRDWTIAHLRPTPHEVVAVATPGLGTSVRWLQLAAARSADRRMPSPAQPATLGRCAGPRPWPRSDR